MGCVRTLQRYYLIHYSEALVGYCFVKPSEQIYRFSEVMVMPYLIERSSYSCDYHCWLETSRNVLQGAHEMDCAHTFRKCYQLQCQRPIAACSIRPSEQICQFSAVRARDCYYFVPKGPS